MVNHHVVARDTTEVGLMRLAGAIAVIMPSLALLQVIVNSRDYRLPVVVIAVWLGVLGAAAWLAPRLRMRTLAAGEAAVAIAIAVVAVAVTGLARRPHGNPASVNLALLGTAWLLVFVLLSRPARMWIPGAVLLFAENGALLIRNTGLNMVSLSQLTATGYIMAALLLVFAALRPTLALHASMAGRRTSLASRSVAERAAATAIARERHDRLAILEQEALPLLRGIASGTLDPATEIVREACARHAAALRDSLTTREPQARELVAALEPALRTARERGLTVTVQPIGDPGIPPPPVARAVMAAVDAALSALAPHQVMLTVLATGADVELYLTFGARPRAAPDLTRFGLDLPAAVRWRAGLVPTESGGGCLEVSWRKDSAT